MLWRYLVPLAEGEVSEADRGSGLHTDDTPSGNCLESAIASSLKEGAKALEGKFRRGSFMKSRRLTVPEMSGIEMAISHVELDAASPLNQNESHIHSACEIYLNLSGDVAFAVENRIYPISRGCVILTRPYEYHHCIYRSNAPHEHYWITFSAGQEDYLKMFFDREKGHDNLIRLEPALLERLLGVLEGLLTESDPLGQRIGCLEMFRILQAGKREEPVVGAEHLPEDVAAALRYMDGHLVEDMDIHDLAAAGNVSVNTLERHFRDALGATPFTVLRRRRLVASMACLRNGDSVTEAALKSGFPDYSNFIQLFRRQFAMTPLQYKKKFME